MEVAVAEKDISVAVLSGGFPQFDNFNWALDAAGNEDELVTLVCVESKLFQEEQRSEMWDEQSGKAHDIFAFLSVDIESGHGLNSRTRGLIQPKGTSAQFVVAKDIQLSFVRVVMWMGNDPLHSFLQVLGQQWQQAESLCWKIRCKYWWVNLVALSDAQYTFMWTRLINSKYPTGGFSWSFDSSASYHIAFDKSLVKTFSPASDSSVEAGTKVRAQFCGYSDVLFQVRAENEMYRNCFPHLLQVHEFERSLFSVSTKDLERINTTRRSNRDVISKGRILFSPFNSAV